MARAKRYSTPGGVFLMSAIGNNRQQVFLEPADFRRFQERIAHFATALRCRVHHYVLLPSEAHLIVSFPPGVQPEALMRRLNLSHARWFNRKYGRRGHLWNDRYRCVVVQPDAHLLACGRFLERLPVESRLVARVADYPWSSAAALGWGAATTLITPSEAYRAFARTITGRQERYRAWLAERVEILAPDRLAADGVFGDAEFRRKIAARTARTRPRRKTSTPRPEIRRGRRASE
jgi:putative transposase